MSRINQNNNKILDKDKDYYLKELEKDGLVERKMYDEMPVRVEYTLTDKAKSLIPILLELKKWGEDNL